MDILKSTIRELRAEYWEPLDDAGHMDLRLLYGQLSESDLFALIAARAGVLGHARVTFIDFLNWWAGEADASACAAEVAVFSLLGDEFRVLSRAQIFKALCAVLHLGPNGSDFSYLS